MAAEEDVPELSKVADFNTAWSKAKARRTALLWTARRPGGRWLAGLDLLPGGPTELAREPLVALVQLRERLRVAGRCDDAASMVSPTRVLLAGLRGQDEADALAAVLGAALRGDAAPAHTYTP